MSVRLIARNGRIGHRERTMIADAAPAARGLVAGDGAVRQRPRPATDVYAASIGVAAVGYGQAR